MLERAQACLKSGARDSLRCTTKASRSRRALNSSFWNHGAGELGLASPPPLNSSVRPGSQSRTDSARSGRGKRREVGGESASDGLFLDFLYPPQAVAWMQRNNGQQKEIWEKRNARKLPDGFVHVARQYATSAHKPDRSQTVEEGRTPDAFDEPLEVGVEEPPVDPAEPTEPTPSELADKISDPLQRLRTLVSITQSRHVKIALADKDKGTFCKKVWKMYDELPENEQSNTDLKNELVTFLPLMEDETSDSRCQTLFESLSAIQRETSTYEGAFILYDRTLDDLPDGGKYDKFIKLYAEATGSPKRTSVLAQALLNMAIEQRNWPFWYRVLKISESKKDMTFEEIETFIQTIPNLLPKAHDYMRHMSEIMQKITPDESSMKLGAMLVEQALLQEFELKVSGKMDHLPPHRWVLLTGNVRAALDHANILGSHAIMMYETLLKRVMKKDVSREYSGTVVSWIYGKLRLAKGYQIPESIFRTLLEWLCRDDITPRRLQKKTPLLTIPFVFREWIDQHGQVTVDGARRRVIYDAKSGMIGAFRQSMTYLKTTYPDYAEYKDILWATIYIHARRANLNLAKMAFDSAKKVAEENNDVLPVRCWNALLHAQFRADDLGGALDNLETMIDQEVMPDAYSFHPVMLLLAKRGDVEGVNDLMEQFDTLNPEGKRNTRFYGTLMIAHLERGEMEQAQAVLKDALAGVRADTVEGKIAGCFNILLNGHAASRNIHNTMAIYRWMKSEEIPVDSETYAALMQVLCHFRVPDKAVSILKTAMKQEKVRPTSFNYAIVMNGYTNIDKHDTALQLHDHMLKRNVTPSFNSNAAYLRAQAKKESRESRHRQHKPLSETIEALETTLSHGEKQLAAKQPLIGGRGLDVASAIRTQYIQSILQIHGQRRCEEAVLAILARFKEDSKNWGCSLDEPPLQLIAAVMAANFRLHKYDEVERYWHLAKAKADEFTKAIPVKPLVLPSKENSTRADLDDELALQFPDNTTTSQPPSPSKTPAMSPPTNTPRTYILSPALRQYYRLLALQHRHLEMTHLTSTLLTQNYNLDIHTWNALIRHLCTASPPLTQLAYTLTERFLIPHFSGWAPVSTSYKPNKSAVAQKLQYIKQRYLKPGVLGVQYQTLVLLGGALLKLRRLEAGGLGAVQGETARYVGSMRGVRKRAPRTVFAVGSMPRRDDGLQRGVLERD